MDTAIARAPDADQLTAELEALPGPAGVEPAAPASPPRKRINYTHDALIDILLTRPELTQNEIAVMLGYTAAWVSTIMASDSFQAKYAARYAQLVDPVARVTIEDRFKAIALRSSELLLEKLNKPAAAVPDQLVIQALNTSAKAAGYGIRPQVNINVNVPERLEKLSENMVGLLRRQRSVIEGESHGIPSHAEAPST